MNAVERMRAKLSNCAAACRGFCMPDNILLSSKGVPKSQNGLGSTGAGVGSSFPLDYFVGRSFGFRKHLLLGLNRGGMMC